MKDRKGMALNLKCKRENTAQTKKLETFCGIFLTLHYFFTLYHAHPYKVLTANLVVRTCELSF